jgi:O-antigen/teichoic acid export membrane protein
VVTPIVLHHLGKGDYGAYVLIAAVVSYSSLLDFGIGLTVMRMVAERAHLSDREELKTITSTALTIYAAIGILLAAAGVVAAPFVGHAFHLHGARLHAFSVGFAIVAGTIGLTFPGGLYTGINQGFGRYRQQNTIVVVQTVGSGVLAVLTVILGGGIVALAAVGMVGAGGAFVAKVIYAARAYGIVPSPRRFDRRVARSVVGTSSWMFLINVANKVIWDLDNVVVGAILSPVAVARYAVALGPATAVRRITDQFNSVSLTAASSLHAQDEREGMRRLLMEATRVVTIVICPFVVLFALWGDQFLRLWVGPTMASSAATLLVLVLGMLASSVQATATQVLLALRRQRTMAVTAVLEACCNLGLSVYLATRIGIVGVALGTTIPTAVTAFGFYLPYAARLLDVSLGRILRRLVLPLCICGGAYLAVRFGLSSLRFSTLPELGVAGAALVGTCIGLSFLLDREERMTYIGVARAFGKQLRVQS